MDPLSQLHQMATRGLNLFFYILLLAAPPPPHTFSIFIHVRVYEQERTAECPHRTQEQSQQRLCHALLYVKKCWRYSVFLTVLKLALQFAICTAQTMPYLSTCVNVLENLCH